MFSPRFLIEYSSLLSGPNEEVSLMQREEIEFLAGMKISDENGYDHKKSCTTYNYFESTCSQIVLRKPPNRNFPQHYPHFKYPSSSPSFDLKYYSVWYCGVLTSHPWHQSISPSPLVISLVSSGSSTAPPQSLPLALLPCTSSSNWLWLALSSPQTFFLLDFFLILAGY